MIKPKLLFAAFFLASLTAFAQEVCNDGVDNDGDGFIDCFDSDCANSNDCDGFYIGNDASCEAKPSEFPEFSLTLDFASPNKSANHLGRIAIGDLDGDGIPEIVSQNYYENELYILNGDDGSVKYKRSFSSNARPYWRIAVANVDGDDCAELFSVFYYDTYYTSNDYFEIVAFDCQLNELWRSERMSKDPVHISLADFDSDGQVELFYKHEVRDAKTGTRIIKSPTTNWDNINGGPVAVDILGDGDLELVSGTSIYQINLGSRTADAGSITELQSRSEYGVKRNHNTTSVADYNQDGFLDVIATGKNSSGVTTVFFWDVTNDQLRTFNDPIESVGGTILKCTNMDPGDDAYKKGWKHGTGRLNIGDLDGNGQLNVSFVSGRFLYALDENFNQLWRKTVNEETSGYTGCTLFDFNGDGKTEVVYRDEQWLYILNGTTGAIETQVQCISRTSVDYPIVADVDADGSTEICVVCGYDDEDAWDEFCDLSYSRNSHVRVFKSNGEPWVPARRVWNQHGYFNVNVNDDLTIPAVQQKHHLVWSTGSCTTGPNRPLNSFLNQSPFLNSQGCPTYASPDLAFVDNSLSIDQPECPELDFTVSFEVTNIGDVKITGDVPISFYNGDPLQAGATKLSTIYVTLNKFNVGGVLAVDNVTITGPGSPFNLYIVLNDGGTTVPTPITMPNTNFLECDYENNILMGLVDPIPFALSTEVTDNIACTGNSTPPNGSARAFRLVGTTEITTDYIFSWFNGTSASGTPDFQGPIYSGLPAGTYSVFATHKSAFCNSDTVQVVVNDVSRSISAEVKLEIPYTHCKNPNGKLSVEVDGGEPTGKYTYEWYVGNITGVGLIISKSHIVADLDPNTYSVLVTEKATGCTTVATGTVPDESVTPVVTASATDINCSDANSGTVSADVGGQTSGYTFRWYSGNSVKPTADYSGSTVSNLAEGSYTVVALNNSTQCASDPVTVVISRTVNPTVAAVKGADNSSCDSTLPNGTASAAASGGSSDFTFEWFTGQNTLAANLRGTGSSISDLPAGTFTVRATDNNTGCSNTAEVTILNNIVMPSLTLSKTDVTQCFPYNGTITAAVSTGTVSEYTFSWYNGNNVKATPDYSETGNVLSDLGPGVYTVEAINNTTHCAAGAKSITIIAPAINIVLDGTASSFPLDCSTASGALKVDVSPSTDPYNIEWYKGNVTPDGSSFFLTEDGVTTSTANNLTTGNYTVRAVNQTTGCEEIAVFYMPLADGHRVDFTASGMSSTCNDNTGSVEVNLTPTSVPGYDEADYEIQLYTGTTTSGTPVTQPGATGVSTYTFSGLSSGNYTVTAVPTDASIPTCPELPIVVVLIEMEVEYPEIIATTIAGNMNCTGSTPTGEIEILINSGAAPSDFLIEWFEGQDMTTALTSGTISADGTLVSDLTAGYYTVQVTDQTTYLSCASYRTFRVMDNTPVVTIPAASIDIDHVSSCAPTNGSQVTINDIMENGISVGIAGYTFEWFDAANNPLAGNTNQISNVAAGVYYVRATNSANSCQSTLLQFEIEDQTIGDPSIDLVSFQNETRCFQPTNFMGELHIAANSNTATTYTYNWYAGTSASGTIIDTDADLTGQPAGDYTVLVMNNTTFCTAQETYTLILEEESIPLTASASPITNCADDDGSVFATVTTSYSNNYTYNWSFGNSISSPADSIGKDVTGLPAGDYTVQAVDQSDATCVSPAITVTIIEQLVMPNLLVEQKAPLTVCDLTRADGSAIASVDGTYIGYTFEWYAGSNATGAPVYTGAEFFGMEAITYTVTATNNITQCMSTQQITIEEDLTDMPDPTIEILSHDTSCEIDNGALSVSIDGNTMDYIFDWYLGEEASGTPVFTGEIYNDLAAGFYTVIATNKNTGCITGPATAEVLEILIYPEFEFVVNKATCSASNGSIKLIITNSVEVDDIVWTGNGLTVTGPNLSEVPAGIYTVTVTTALGCFVTEDVEILAEVNPFNGISRNGDSANDRFRIGCIEDYPDNIVKIFNRAGTQVFEAEGYDNQSKYFDGASNKGISVMGNNLPDGTYFYVIDKRDGTKPLAGYLEIVN